MFKYNELSRSTNEENMAWALNPNESVYRTTLESIRTPQKIFNNGQPRT